MRATRKPAASPRPKPNQKSDEVNLVTFVLDRSGSMSSCRDATISGFNEFKADQRNAPGSVLFSLTTFNTDITIEHAAKPLGDVPDLSTSNYVPDGMTALYDAIGHTVRNLEEKLKAMPHKPARNLFVIMTDGEENSSQEFTREKVFRLIESKKAEGWTFVFLGANQDAFAAGAHIGVAAGNIAAYAATPKGTRAAMASVQCSTQAFYGSGAAATSSFFDSGQRPAVPPDFGKYATPKQPQQPSQRRRWDSKL